jgi:hypothetical protein
MEKFEYKAEVFNTEGCWDIKLNHHEFTETLNKLGQQGWELVNVFDINRGQGHTCDVVAVFKRRITS